MSLVIGYVRCSSTEQAESGLGIDAQRAVILAEAKRRGVVVHFIEDRGASGKDLKRQGMQTALGMLQRGEADTLIAAKLDRLSRSVFDFADLMRRADAEGWAVVALDLGVDTATPNGRLVANVMASVAEWERERIGERTRDALRAARERGVRLGGPRTISDDLRRRVVAMRAVGKTLQAIADVLNSDGIATARGGTWQRGTVHALLRSARLDGVTAAASSGSDPQITAPRDGAVTAWSA